MFFHPNNATLFNLITLSQPNQPNHPDHPFYPNPSHASPVSPSSISPYCVRHLLLPLESHSPYGVYQVLVLNRGTSSSFFSSVFLVLIFLSFCGCLQEVLRLSAGFLSRLGIFLLNQVLLRWTYLSHSRSVFFEILFMVFLFIFRFRVMEICLFSCGRFFIPTHRNFVFRFPNSVPL